MNFFFIQSNHRLGLYTTSRTVSQFFRRSPRKVCFKNAFELLSVYFRIEPAIVAKRFPVLSSIFLIPWTENNPEDLKIWWMRESG